jgi:hypothetical protein
MASFRLPRLPVNWKEQPQLFERYWDETLLQIEKTLNAILDIPVIKQAVQDAQSAAVNAQQAAETAQQAAENANSNAGSASEAAAAAAQEASLVNSYVSGYSGSLITASATGIVNIAQHTRVYGDPSINPSVTVNGGSINTGAQQGDVLRIYYNDPTRAGGNVTYKFTNDSLGDAPPAQKGVLHSVGAVLIPASGNNNGKPLRPPGYVEL